MRRTVIAMTAICLLFLVGCAKEITDDASSGESTSEELVGSVVSTESDCLNPNCLSITQLMK